MICASQLSVAYGEVAVLDGIDLEVAEGEFVVVAGASGSGKSTLLGALCGLVPHTTGATVGGELVVGGVDLRESGPSGFGKVCGWVGQVPEEQLVLRTPRAELALGPEVAGEPPAAVARSVEEAALALRVHELLDRDSRTLSGGEQQRVAIGAALTQHPRVLVLDEPTSQLDPVGGDELLGLLRRLNEEWGLTIVLAEHRLERCLPAATRVVALGGGRITFDGSPGGFCEWAPGAAPELATSASRLLAPLGRSADAVSVRSAQRALRESGIVVGAARADADADVQADIGSSASKDVDARPRLLRRGKGAEAPPALHAHGLWRELRDGKVLLRDVSLTVQPGEAVAVMGRNGAGKSTLLHLLAGIAKPDRGRVEAAGRVALMLQRPADHLLHERVGDELWEGADLSSAGLDHIPGFASRHPSELSGGELQRLAALVVTGQTAPSVLCLDEPTRGLDREARRRLAAQLAALRAAGTATVVATHDPEFAAEIAERVLMLAGGEVLVDAPAREVLGGGWYFATEIARVLRGAGDAITLEQGAAVLTAAARAAAKIQPQPMTAGENPC